MARLFGWLAIAEAGGIRLEETNTWEVDGIREVERFLRALPLLVPQGATVYFEGTGESHVAAYLQQVSVPSPLQIAAGTIWPRPDRYHVPLTRETMDAMAAFLERHPAGFVCAHCHVHDGASILLEWHDAFGADPMRVSTRVGEEAVSRFASACGSSYRLERGDDCPRPH